MSRSGVTEMLPVLSEQMEMLNLHISKECCFKTLSIQLGNGRVEFISNASSKCHKAKPKIVFGTDFSAQV